MAPALASVPAKRWRWVNLPGGHAEQPVADFVAGTSLLGGGGKGGEDEEEGLLDGAPGFGRGYIAVQTNATSSFHVIFGHAAECAASRGADAPVLRFVVGKRRNSMTSVGLGNPYIKKEPIEFTKSPDALLTADAEESRTYWFLYDRTVAVAAMGVQAEPQAGLCRLCCRFQDAVGFRAEVCEQLRYVSLASGKRPVSLRVVHVGYPPDVSIPRHRFDPVGWRPLPWEGASCVFELDAPRGQLVERAQQLLAASPIAPLYAFGEPRCFCLNAYRLLDPHRRAELQLAAEAGDADSAACGGDEDEDGPAWELCHAELQRRLEPVMRSAPWTYWPLKFERADCTTVTLAPTGPGCQASLRGWLDAVRAHSGLANGATSRELLTITFAYEVFPVEGENAARVRRDLVREITALLSKEWGTMEFRAPLLARWRTHAEYNRADGSCLEP